MKKLTIGAGALLVILVLVALAAPSFVDWNTYRPQLVAAVKEATGRELAVDGGLDLSLLPSPELSAKGVRLASVPGASEPDMLRIRELEVRIALLPLLSGDVKVRSVRLIDPVVVLEELEDGRVNWAFEPQDGSAAPAPAEEPSQRESGGGFALSLDDVRVRNATAIYRNARTGAEERLDGLSFEGSAGSLQGPFEVEGELRRADLPIAFSAQVGALQAGRSTPVRLSLTLEERGATAEFSGSLTGLGDQARIAGRLKAQAESLAKALAQSSGLLARPFALEAAIDASAAAAAANDLLVRLGDMQSGGAISVAFGQEPRFDATLNATRVDLDALLAAAPATAPAQKRATKSSNPAPEEEAGFALPQGLSGSLTASIDGVVYRGAAIRQAQLNAELAGGKLTVKRLAALLPGGSDAALSGALTAQQGGPQFDGRLELASDNLRGLLAWLDIEPSGAPVERLNTASLTSGVRVTPQLAEFANINLRLDGSTVTGGAAYRLQERPSFAVDLAIDRLNLDPYLAPAESPTGGSAQGRPAAQEAASGPSLAALNAFDANVKLRAGQLVYRRTPFRNATLDATLAGGRLTVRQASIQEPAGATVAASGTASEFAGEPKFAAELTLAADDLSGLAQLAGARAANAAKVGRTELKAALQGGMNAFDFKADGALAGGRLAAEGKVSGLQQTPAFDATLNAEHKDLVALVRNFGVDWKPAAQNLGGLTVNLAAKGAASAVELPKLAIKAGPANLEGAARLKLDGAKPYLSAKLQASEILADLFLEAPGGGEAAPAQRRQGSAPAQARPGEPRWSREPLNLAALEALDADVELAARGLSFRKYDFDEPRLTLALKDGTLRISQLTGKLFDGAVALSGALAAGPQPGLTLDVKLDGADVNRALVAAMDLDAVSGRLDFTGAFRAAGRSEWEMVSSLEGDARLEAGEGVLRGVDLPSLSARLGELDGAAAFVDLAARSFAGGETRIRSARGTWQVKNGIATTRDTRAVLDAAEATLTGGIQLPAWRMDLRSEIALTDHPKAPPIGVVLSGPLDAPQRDVKTQAMEQYLAARVGSELLRKGLGDKVKELAPLEELLGGGRRQPQGAAPAPSQPQQPAQQPAPPPAQQAIEGLLKGLLKK